MTRFTGPLAGALFGLLLTTLSTLARADEGAWASGTAIELTRQGAEHARAGDDQLAATRFAEAIRLDPTYGPAYLELAAARERAGDLGEAERTYDVAIEHIAHFVAGFRARAALFGRMGQTDKATSDLETAARLTDDPEILRDLAARYVEAEAWPAALATWRKLLVLTEKSGDARPRREASTQIRALEVLSGELDPVSWGAKSHDWVRRAEASVAKRQGM